MVRHSVPSFGGRGELGSILLTNILYEEKQTFM